MAQPFVVGIGGSNRASSTTDTMLRLAVAHAAARGATTQVFDGAFLSALPIFGSGEAPEAAQELAGAVASADAVILASPGYHGGISGLVKNGVDHLELLRDAPRPYLDGRPVGTIVTAAGWQACGTALVSLRSTIHALRGWPTPFGAMVNTAEPIVDAEGALVERVAGALQIVADQVMDFVGWRR